MWGRSSAGTQTAGGLGVEQVDKDSPHHPQALPTSFTIFQKILQAAWPGLWVGSDARCRPQAMARMLGTIGRAVERFQHHLCSRGRNAFYLSR